MPDSYRLQREPEAFFALRRKFFVVDTLSQGQLPSWYLQERRGRIEETKIYGFFLEAGHNGQIVAEKKLVHGF
jgi:hypothetical protein